MKLIIVMTFALMGSVLGQDFLLRSGQSGQFPNFPYCLCKGTGAYKVDNTVTYKGDNTYCFKVRVSIPTNCSEYCCQQADLKKLEINVRPACNVPGVVLTATLNGAPTTVNPNFELAPQGPLNSTILKITQLGLNLATADSAEICVKLGTNRGGIGCTTLEQLCLPSVGAAPGVCSIALFSSNNNCCPTSIVNNAVPPAAPPQGPIDNSLRLCTTCVNFTLSSGVGIVPYNFTQAQCAAYAKAVAAGFLNAAFQAGTDVFRNFTLNVCSGRVVSVCGKFEDYKGALVAPYADDLASQFLALVAPGGAPPPYLAGHTITVTISSERSNELIGRRLLQDSMYQCPLAEKSLPLTPANITFPKCICNTTQGVLPFATLPFYTTKPGVSKGSTQYCFTFTSITPLSGPCASVNIFAKVEFWANDTAPLRRSLKGFYVRSSSETAYTFLAATWSSFGDQTVRATGLDWNKQEANGAEVCMELDNSVSLDTFCLGPYSKGCYVNIFDKSKNCCPLYATVDAPYVP
ncbi:hypothetical protein Vretimale_9306 [Volvox reticuliferus]|uniref:Pherophorin domain-containing protein n=1 Tax=Volvox reticuliferus TaxID=1737510 RepID=A0A8J4GD83_9CHLO|nr:hypothetical protein Vretifemale_10140 [Volvox reticuliferus]GIM04800.1 hypothetical protein Vretimale_9306 [Volvox reticuliferus]